MRMRKDSNKSVFRRGEPDATHKKHHVIYVDIDGEKPDDKTVESICTHLMADAYLFETANGWHLKIFAGYGVEWYHVLDAMLILGADRRQILAWLYSGEFTLFEVRRGRVNSTLVRTYGAITDDKQIEEKDLNRRKHEV